MAKIKDLKNNYKAFTLAEVLITLGIIGVVAALTIPSLMKNTQDSELRNAFKKEYSSLSQAMLKLSSDNGGSIAGLSGIDNTFRNLFLNYFNYSKTCDTNDSSCWTCNGTRTTDYMLDGTPRIWYQNRPTIVLNDGAMLNFTLIASDCTGTDSGLIAPYAGSVCGAIVIDVNGCKSPNKWGRDIYNIEVQSNKIFPQGPSVNNNAALSCDYTHTWSGVQCAEFVLKGQDY